MTSSPGLPPRPPRIVAKPGRLLRWKLEEPVRLYLYALLTVAVLGLTLAGYLTEEWAGYWAHVAGVVLGVIPAAEAIRASVYSPAGHALHAAGTMQRIAATAEHGVAFVTPESPR